MRKKQDRNSLALEHTKGRWEKVSSRQLPLPISSIVRGVVMPSTIITASTILKSHGSPRLAGIARSNSFLLQRLFPYYAKQASQTETSQNAKGQLDRLTQSSADFSLTAFQSKPSLQSTPVLKNTVTPYINYKTTGSRYENQNIIASSSPNGYSDASIVPYKNARLSQTANGLMQASFDPYSHLTNQVTAASTNILSSPNTHEPALSTERVSDIAGVSKQFYTRLLPWGNERRKVPTADKIVTEGELKEKGLLAHILSRDHINYRTRVIWKKRKRSH